MQTPTHVTLLLIATLMMACTTAEEVPQPAPSPAPAYTPGFGTVDHSNVPRAEPGDHQPDGSSGLADAWGDPLPSPDSSAEELYDAEEDPGPLTAPDTQYSADGFEYECDTPFTTKPCVTECGSTGEHSCVKVWGPCEPPEEICNGMDDDCDGVIDNGVLNECGACGEVPAETCNGADDDCDGGIDEGVTNACGACGPVGQEVCNGVDDNCDGQIDEGVSNACGGCGAVPQEVCNGFDDDCDGQVDEGVSNACGGCGPVPQEVCNGIDDDCDGVVDGIPFELNLSGDCLYVQCPDYAPFPTACNIIMQGGDHRGCVASQPNLSVVYFQEGNQCGLGSLGGTLTCSCSPGVGLNAQNCPINKQKKYYPSTPSGCPD